MVQRIIAALAFGYLLMTCSQHMFEGQELLLTFKILLGQTVCSVMQMVIRNS